MRINRNNGIMETSPCKDQKQGQGQGLDHKDQDKDKYLTHKDQDKDKDLTPKDQDKDKDLTPKDQDKDKDLKNVLKESLRTRTGSRINIPRIKWSWQDLSLLKPDWCRLKRPFVSMCQLSFSQTNLSITLHSTDVSAIGR